VVEVDDVEDGDGTEEVVEAEVGVPGLEKLRLVVEHLRPML
jgi:hypothetical protein